MSGEILADGNSPMIMTVDQYNERVAYTWKLATEAEQERIVKLLEAWLDDDYGDFGNTLKLIKGETK
jgi:endonuclease III